MSTSNTMYISGIDECRCRTHSHNCGKSGLAVLVERDKLAVEDRAHQQLREKADALRHVPAAAAAHTQRPLGGDDRAEPSHFSP